jgi:hypothetical protein
MADIADGEEDADEGVYVFEPTQLQVTRALPLVLHVVPENVVLAAGQDKFVTQGRGQRGLLCPSCHYNDTKYKGYEKRPNATQQDHRRAPTQAESKVDKITCNAAVRQKSSNPCLTCPVCSQDQELMDRISHDCTGLVNNPSVAIKPGASCGHCDYKAQCVCKCDLCNVAKHERLHRHARSLDGLPIPTLSKEREPGQPV